VRLACVENQGNPVGEHCFASKTGTIGPRKMRHKSSIIVTSIAAPKASTATLGKSHLSPGFSSILHIHMNNHQDEYNADIFPCFSCMQLLKTRNVATQTLLVKNLP